MTDRYEKIRKMSTHDIELPQGYAERPFDYSGDLYVEGQMRDYASAKVEHHTATLQAEIKRLRAERESLWVELENWKECYCQAASRAEQLEKILGAEAEYEYEVWQGDALQAGGRETDYASAQSEANHYAMMYAPDGPVEVRIYEKRLLSTTQQYGVLPECGAQQPADDEVVFYDGVGAGRSSVKSCRDGVQWIRVGDRVYWPLSDSDAKRLQSACCGNGSFDGPSTPDQEEEK